MNNYSLTLNNLSENGNSLKVDLLNIKKAALTLRAVNHKLRQQILRLIDEHGKIVKVFEKVRPAEHSAELLSALDIAA